ncbi:helix-turn-helix domain-containing protein [Paenibacillus sp. JMULE4]
MEWALKTANGNRVQAARALNISRSALYRKMEKHGINC